MARSDTGMDFRGLVWKRVWKITFSGLKSGQDLENWAAHPHQEFPGVPPPPPPGHFMHWLKLDQSAFGLLHYCCHWSLIISMNFYLGTFIQCTVSKRFEGEVTIRKVTFLISAAQRCSAGTWCCNHSKQRLNNVATLCCAKNRRCESSRVTSSVMAHSKEFFGSQT